MRRTGKLAWKQVALGCFVLALAAVAAANLACALIYGEVFLARGSGWAALDHRPVAFLISMLASLVMTPFGGFMGVLLLRTAREDLRAAERSRHAARYEDPSKRSRLRG